MPLRSSFVTVLREVAAMLEKAALPHALIGGIAVGLHGYARATGDVDFLVDAAQSDKIVELMTRAGFRLAAQTQETLSFDGKAFVDMLLARREPTRQMLADAQFEATIGVRVVRVEDVIGLKIQAFSNDGRRKWHDQADIAELIRCNPGLDWERVLNYAMLFGATQVLQEIRTSVLS